MKKENMKKYLNKIKDLILSFQSFERTNALAKLAASLPSNLWKDTYFKVLKKLSLEEPQLVQ